MTLPDAIVFVVDNETPRSARRSRDLSGRSVWSGSIRLRAREFLAVKRPDAPACLVLDVRLPDVSGLEFQRELADANVEIPIIFITGHADVPMTVRAIKASGMGVPD